MKIKEEKKIQLKGKLKMHNRSSIILIKMSSKRGIIKLKHDLEMPVIFSKV